MTEHRLLACFAHPDDEAFPVGGALAAHSRRGVDVRLITTTLGEEGEIRQEGSATRETLGGIREVELSCAVRALRLGSNDVWGYRDSGMQGWESNPAPQGVHQRRSGRGGEAPCAGDATLPSAGGAVLRAGRAVWPPGPHCHQRPHDGRLPPSRRTHRPTRSS